MGSDDIKRERGTFYAVSHRGSRNFMDMKKEKMRAFLN